MLAYMPAPWILWDMVFLFPRIHVSSNHGLGAGFRPTDWTSSPWAPNSVAASSASASRGKEIGLRWEGHSLDIHWTLDIDGRWCTLMDIHWTSIEFIGKWMDLMDIHAHWSDKWRRPTRWGNNFTTWEWPLTITWRISQLCDNPPTVKGLLFNEAWRSERFFFMSCPAFMFIVTSLGTDRNRTDQFLRVPPYRNFRELQRCRTRLGPGPVHWLTTNFATLKCSSGGGPEHIEIIAEDSPRQGGFW